MNCHHARQLISPYLDHQLSGRESLALQDHLAVCVSCDRERQSIRQVKLLLRGLAEPRMPQELSRRFSATVALRLEQPDSGMPGWRVMLLPPPRPQRGRRLATALALSCLTVVSFALPFAPEARDSARSAASGGPVFPVPASTDALLSGQPPERVLMVSPGMAPAGFSVPRGDMLTLADTAAPDLGFRTQDASPSGSQFAVFRPR